MFDLHVWQGNDRVLCAGLDVIKGQSTAHQELYSRKNSPFLLAYDQTYVLENFVNAKNASLSDQLPLTLFEVFTGEAVADWIGEFSPLPLHKISPVNTISNVVVISNESFNSANVSSSENVLDIERSYTEVSGQRSIHKSVGWFAGQQFCFGVATQGGFRSHLLDDFNQPENCIMYPYRILQSSLQQDDVKFCRSMLKTHTAFFAELNTLLSSPDAKVDQDQIFVPRIDVIEVEGVPTLHSLKNMLSCVDSKNDDLFDVINKNVSTYFQGNDGLKEAVIQCLKRDILCRCFSNCHQRNAFNIVDVDGQYSFANVIWDTDDNYLLSANELQWPEYLTRSDHPDYPLICESFSHLVSAETVLFELFTFVENLLQLSSRIDEINGCSHLLLHDRMEFNQLASRLNSLGLLV